MIVLPIHVSAHSPERVCRVIDSISLGSYLIFIEDFLIQLIHNFGFLENIRHVSYQDWMNIELLCIHASCPTIRWPSLIDKWFIGYPTFGLKVIPKIIFVVMPYKRKFLFPVPARITFRERIKKIFIFYFIEFDVFVTTINYFSVKAEPFCPLFQSKYVSIRFYDLSSW